MEVDEAFPLMTIDGVSAQRPRRGTGDEGPAASERIETYGVATREQDPKAFTAAFGVLRAVNSRGRRRYQVRAARRRRPGDLGSVTGGQASLYLGAGGARADHRTLDSHPLRTDADRRIVRPIAAWSGLGPSDRYGTWPRGWSTGRAGRLGVRRATGDQRRRDAAAFVPGLALTNLGAVSFSFGQARIGAVAGQLARADCARRGRPGHGAGPGARRVTDSAGR